MKEGLSSIDVHVLVRELGGLLRGAKFEKAYQVGSRELLLTLHAPGAGVRDLVLAPNYFCLTGYSRIIPKKPTSFAMQLRKRLRGLRVEDVRQHESDRIVEFVFGGRERLILVAELFSKGNVILCGEDMRILGLLEWQKWRHRVLGVGKVYEYPPAGVNVFEIDESGFRSLFSGCESSVVSVLASVLGLGGFIAEEICLMAGVDKSQGYGSLTGGVRENLWTSFRDFFSGIRAGDVSSYGVFEGGRLVDVLPFKSRQYEGRDVRRLDGFNDAVDGFFSSVEAESLREGLESKAASKRLKLEGILRRQLEAVGGLEGKSVVEKSGGDLIYQHLSDIEGIVEFVSKSRRRGLSDDEIVSELRKLSAGGLVKSLQGVELVLDL